jgi:hypothetical protein
MPLPLTRVNKSATFPGQRRDHKALTSQLAVVPGFAPFQRQFAARIQASACHPEPGARVGLLEFEVLVEELWALTGRQVDLVTKRRLKPWVCPDVLRDVPSSMRHEVSFRKDILLALSQDLSDFEATSEEAFRKDEVLPAFVLHHLTVIGDVPFYRLRANKLRCAASSTRPRGAA